MKVITCGSGKTKPARAMRKKCLDACAGSTGSAGLAKHRSGCTHCRAHIGYTSFHCSQQVTPFDTCRNRPFLDFAQAVKILCWISHCTDSWRNDGVCEVYGCYNDVFHPPPREAGEGCVEPLPHPTAFGASRTSTGCRRRRTPSRGESSWSSRPRQAVLFRSDHRTLLFLCCMTKATAFYHVDIPCLKAFPKGI